MGGGRLSLKLRVATWLAGEGAFVRLLDEVESQTLAALDALLRERAPGAAIGPAVRTAASRRTLAERRAAMTIAQNERVRALVEALGRDEAIRAGREALFPAGVRLGTGAREQLGVGDTDGDLERAARLLYKALGIDFTLEHRADGTMTMHVHRCALAGHYMPEACEILSAADEGVVAGLSPKHSMRFEERMTTGNAECRARITEAGK
jgi:hypothetical protein